MPQALKLSGFCPRQLPTAAQLLKPLDIFGGLEVCWAGQIEELPEDLVGRRTDDVGLVSGDGYFAMVAPLKQLHLSGFEARQHQG